MAILTNDPKILILAFLGGIIPSLLWLRFWLKEDEENPEPPVLLTLVFIMGMIVVFIVLPIQKYIQANIGSHGIELLLWASTEEILKFLAVFLVLYKTNYADKPIDWPMYLITCALGFAALENTLFLIKPISVVNGATVALLTGNLRFLGSTLLHTVASGTIGITIGITSHLNKYARKFFFLVGLSIAIALHTAFNFFIIKNDGNDFIKVFGFLWVVTIVIMLLFEKVRRMSE